MKKNIFKLLLVITICLLLTGCSEEEKEKKTITHNAVDYLSTKYNIKKDNIEIKDNKLYGNSTICLTNCPDNELKVTVKKEEYTITYNRKDNVFSDNYEVKTIVNDYIAYIKSKLKVGANITIEDAEKIRVEEKYNGKIDEFLKDNNLNAIIIVEATTQDQAILNWRAYSLDAITSLEDLDINYNLRFSVIDNDKETIIYNYKSTTKDNKFAMENNITNEKLECDRDTLVNATCRNR